MMKKLLGLAIALSCTAAYGQRPAQDAQSGQNGRDPNPTICQSVGETGTRLGRQRICMTRSQWAEYRRENRLIIERVQTNRPLKGE